MDDQEVVFWKLKVDQDLGDRTRITNDRVE